MNSSLCAGAPVQKLVVKNIETPSPRRAQRDNKFNFSDDSELSCDESEIHIYSESPFSELDPNDNIQIQEINFIAGANLVYYNIYYSNNNKHYYGLIVVKLNKILYNIENEFVSFLPYSKYEILAITSSTAYWICIVKNSNSCIKTCLYDILIPEKEGNTCNGYCDPDKVKLVSYNLCLIKEECNISIYTLNSDETECGLCNFFYPTIQKYKLFNFSYCLSYLPNNTEFYNEESLILNFKNNYYDLIKKVFQIFVIQVVKLVIQYMKI